MPVTTKRKPALTEAEQCLPEYLQLYTGYMDDEANVKWSERLWRVERNRWLGIVERTRAPRSETRPLLAEMLAACELVCNHNLSSNLYDHFYKLGAKLQRAIKQIDDQAPAKRERMAYARSLRAEGHKGGRPPNTYKVTDGSGNYRFLIGLSAVAELTGVSAKSIRAQLSQGGGAAWLKRRTPEDSWKVVVRHKDGSYADGTKDA